MRNCQVLSEIYQAGVGRKEAQEWKTIEMERTVQQNRTARTLKRNGTDNFTPFLGKRCRRATQTERTVFITFLDAYRIRIVIIFHLRFYHDHYINVPKEYI